MRVSCIQMDMTLGAVEEGYLLGKVELVLFPFANFGPFS